MTITEAKNKIEEQIDFDGPYSHNLIGLYLQSVAKKHGPPAANKLIKECGLENLGWKTVRHRCYGCGELKEDCTFAPDPYRSDVGNDETPVWECSPCRHDSAMDI